MVDDLAAPLGGWQALDEGTRQTVRRAAGLCVKAELLEADLAAGRPVDAAELVAVTNTLARLLDRLAAAAPRPREKSLEEYLAERGADESAEPEEPAA